jgi:hypothetical protein
MHPWKLDSKYMKYKLKLLRTERLFSHYQLVCFRDSVTAWFTLVILYAFKAQ